MPDKFVIRGRTQHQGAAGATQASGLPTASEATSSSRPAPGCNSRMSARRPTRPQRGAHASRDHAENLPPLPRPGTSGPRVGPVRLRPPALAYPRAPSRSLHDRQHRWPRSRHERNLHDRHCHRGNLEARESIAPGSQDDVGWHPVADLTIESRSPYYRLQAGSERTRAEVKP